MYTKKILAGLPLILAAQGVNAAMLDIEITNLTQGLHFTPLMVAAHDDNVDFYDVAAPASSELQAMAEGGAIDGLQSILDSLGGVYSANPAAGLLAPANKTMVMDLDSGSFGLLSITAMILPTNDGFVGLDSWPIPTSAGTYTVYLNAYDAGTEANDEIINGAGAPGAAGIPADPSGMNGTGATGVTALEANANVHIHRGVLGDTDADGGVSDLDSRVHRWLNPVAKVVITVK